MVVLVARSFLRLLDQDCLENGQGSLVPTKVLRRLPELRMVYVHMPRLPTSMHLGMPLLRVLST